jgi:CheY-like chemotaxis protein
MHEGLGLGLSIVKRLCKISNTELSVSSIVGEGTTFTLQTKYKTSDIPGNPEIPVQAAVNHPINHQSSLLDARNIALFEDDPTIFHAYEQALMQNGFTVLALSENSEELASQLANINHIDCILSDFRLKNTTGDLIVQQLRDSFGVDIPAIIVTADTSPKHIRLFKALDIEVLYKPIGYNNIVDAITSLLNKSNHNNESGDVA